MNQTTLIRDHLAAIAALREVRRAISTLEHRRRPVALRAQKPGAVGWVARRRLARLDAYLAQLARHEADLVGRVAA